MRDRRHDLCPKCGGAMRRVQYSERTVRGGMWYEARCHNCGHVEDVFVPRRKNRRNNVRYQ